MITKEEKKNKEKIKEIKINIMIEDNYKKYNEEKKEKKRKKKK